MMALDHVSSDLEDHISSVLRIAYFLTILAVILSMTLFTSGPFPVCSLTVLMGGMGLSAGFRLRRHLSVAAYLYVGALLLAFTALPFEKGVNQHFIFLFLLPIIAASILLTEKGVLGTTLLTSLLMFGSIASLRGTSEAFRSLPLPLLLCGVTAGVALGNTRRLRELATWALEIQSKGTYRAEAFYAQREALADAHLKLQHAKSILEHSNARLAAANIKLEEAEHAAVQASQAKSTFMSNMSHELRTPLNVIIGYSSSMLTMPQMFNDETLPDIYHEYVRLIEDSGQYLLSLINDILDLSKIEASKLSLYPETFALPPLLKGLVATAVGLVKDKPILVRSAFDDTLPLVYADPTRVRQILLNLMSNAVKFTTSGSITLAATFEENVIRVSVTDTGIGIGEEALEHLFNRYEQSDYTTDQSYRGGSLRLDISKQLCLMHGGDLTVTSTLGQGSCFSFTLPVARSDMASKLESTRDEDSAEENTLLDLAVVLLMDRQAPRREAVRKMLESSGYYVLIAHNYQQTIDMAEALLPSLIILDATRNRTDADEMLRHLHQNTETAAIPFILYAERSSVDDTESSVMILAAPVTSEAVLAAAYQLAPRSDANKRSI